MNAVTERVVEMLQAREWKYEVDEECQMVNTGFTGHNAQWRVTAGGFNDFTILILSHFPVDCPQPRRRACAELLTRINYGLSVGAFEMHLDSGRINFKITRPYEGELPPQEELSCLLTLNLRHMDHYLPTIMQVIYAGADPAKAVATLEASFAKEQKVKKAKACRPKSTAPSRFQMN